MNVFYGSRWRSIYKVIFSSCTKFRVMALLETLDDDIADLLGSDNEQSFKQLETKKQQYKQKVRNLRQKNQVKTNPNPSQIKTPKDQTNTKSEKQSSKTSKISMSQEEALSLLHSESLKSLSQHPSTELSTKSIKKASSNSDLNSPATHEDASVSVSDDDSNDSILDWLDEPRKRQPLLPAKPKQPATVQDKVTVEQWKEWLELDTNKAEDAEFMHLAESAAEMQLPDEWEKVNDNLYHNIRSNERRMTHPLLEEIQNELKSLRNKKTILKSTNPIPLSTLNEQMNVPLRQIPDDAPDTESSSVMEQVLVPKTQSHQLEMSRAQKENDDLRALNSKLLSEHQSELMVEDRARKELAHQMELHRLTVEELKKQHFNEIEMLKHMHSKQLRNMREHNKSEGQLNLLISKVETSTLHLHRLQKDIDNQKQRESKITQKEKILDEKDEDLVRERAAYRELLERFQLLVEETKIEKINIREADERLKKREQKIVCDLADSNREIHIERDALNEERRKFELCKTRWNKQKEDELDDIQRLKNEHNKCIQTFYETQEIERRRRAKQRQILDEDKARVMQMKKEFDVERDALEQEKHQLEMEQSKFERKVQDVTALSHRVCQQSELVNKMYNDSAQIEHDNELIRMQLTSQTKELKMIKQQILIQTNQIQNERKMLEEEQLSSLTAKRDLLQQIDSIHAHALRQQQQQQHNVIHNKAHNHPNVHQINEELKELKAFVHECKQNISNYKTDLNHFKHKRESIKSSLALANHSNHLNRMRMSFPSIIPKRIGNSNLSALNHTESTLQSSFVSMVNIDTPITIDNKTKKHMNKIKEQGDDNMPLTPTPMPNLSKIHQRRGQSRVRR
eukprot:148295_1